MSSTIKIKRSSSTASPTALASGELAYSWASGADKLYIGWGSETTPGEADNIDPIGGKYYTDLLSHTYGTLTSNAALIADTNKAIDSIIIGNSLSTGGSVILKEGTNNGTNQVELKAPNSITANIVYTLPGTDGTSGQFLKTDGTGGLSFASAATSLSDLGLTANSTEINVLDGITSSTAELNILTGVTANSTEINLLDGVTSSTSELNILTGVTANSTEINLLDGVTSSTSELNILTGVTANSTEINLLDGLTASTAELNILDGVTANSTELNLLDGVTANTTELNYLDITTIGTVEASKAVTANSLGGITFSGDVDFQSSYYVKNLPDPVNNRDAANKQYVDGIAQGLYVHEAVHAATTDTLDNILSLTAGTVTYNNGSSGVGAYLDLNGNGLNTLDGHSLHDGDRLLIKNEANSTWNGIYSWDTANNTYLTRTTDFDTSVEVAGGDFLFVQFGDTYGQTGFVQVNDVNTIGTDDISFVQFSGQGHITAGEGLEITGTVFDVLYDDVAIGLNVSNQLYIKDASISDTLITGPISLSKLANSSVGFSDGSNTTYVQLGTAFTFSGTSGISVSEDTGTLTVEGVNATDTTVGVASFSNTNFDVTSGLVTIIEVDGGTY